MKLEELTKVLKGQHLPAQNLNISPSKFNAAANEAGYSNKEVKKLIDGIAFLLCSNSILRLKGLAENNNKYDDKALYDIALLKNVIESLENSRRLLEEAHKRESNLKQYLAFIATNELGGTPLDESIKGMKYCLIKLLEKEYPSGESGHHKSMYQPILYRLSKTFYKTRCDVLNLNPNSRKLISEKEWLLYCKVLRAVFRALVELSESEIRSIDKNLKLFKKDYSHYFQ